MKNTTNIKIAKKYESAIESIQKINSGYFLKLNNGYESLEGSNWICADNQAEMLFLIRHYIREARKTQNFAKGDTVVLTNSRGAKGLVWLNDFDLSNDTATVTKLGGIGAVTVSLGKICHTSEYADDLDTIREMLNEFNQQLAEQPLKGGK